MEFEILKEPEFTCPKKEEIEEILNEFSDTKHSETQLSHIVDKLIEEYKSQYEHYVDRILSKLDEYKEAVCEVRDYADKLKEQNEELRKLLKQETKE